YSAHSAFAYIGAEKLSQIAQRFGRRVVHRPFHLSPVMEAAGGKSFHDRSAAHVAYFFGREIERWAAFRSLPIIDYRPTYHDEDMTLASCVLIAAARRNLEHFAAKWTPVRGNKMRQNKQLERRSDSIRSECALDVDTLSFNILQAHWRDDADIADDATVSALVRDCGLEETDLMKQAASSEARETYRRNTEEAIARSVFGSPTYFLDGDMFYGQDRLEMMEHVLGGHVPAQ
ncbi:MAG: DsbA family protein, partial [Pseudomonadota bacterium]